MLEDIFKDIDFFPFSTLFNCCILKMSVVQIARKEEYMVPSDSHLLIITHLYGKEFLKDRRFWRKSTFMGSYLKLLLGVSVWGASMKQVFTNLMPSVFVNAFMYTIKWTSLIVGDILLVQV